MPGTYNYEFRTYDRFKRLTKVQDHGWALWTYSYDMAGNRLTASDPDLGDWTYSYDLANRLIQQKDARGVVTSMRYDQAWAVARAACGVADRGRSGSRHQHL